MQAHPETFIKLDISYKDTTNDWMWLIAVYPPIYNGICIVQSLSLKFSCSNWLKREKFELYMFCDPFQMVSQISLLRWNLSTSCRKIYRERDYLKGCSVTKAKFIAKTTSIKILSKILSVFNSFCIWWEL